MRFRDRTDAGRQLAARLESGARHANAVVLALPRGGVPVGAEIASALNLPLDVFLVRKLGVPGQEELAMGAVAEGGIQVLNDAVVGPLRIPPAAIEQTARRERVELDRRQQQYRQGRPRVDVTGRQVILVDDGLATGASMEAAILALRRLQPQRIIVAVPVGARETCSRLSRIADELVCLAMPEPFDAVGLWYDEFTQTTDAEVRAALAASASTPRAAAGNPGTRSSAIELLRGRVIRLAGSVGDYDALIEGVGEARVVLLGEASHGTHEFYRERAAITKRLIADKGFRAVAVEADWPDAYRVNRYVRGAGADADAVEALADFRRFPAWMWRNADVLDFVGWLRARNETLPERARTGFYGLDLYSLHASMQAVLAYLQKVDRDAHARARAHYACFDRFGEQMQAYAYQTAYGLSPSCEREVLTELVALRRKAAEYASRDGRLAADDHFFAEQNARLVASAEAYYRTMIGGRVESWNLRDRHMTDTLDSLIAYLDRQQPDARVVVWAHNSHLGDARATEMGRAGELNVGQLVRERYGGAARLVGFTTHAGTVTAASEWDGPAERKHVRPSLEGSHERLFHEVGERRFLLPLRRDPDVAALLSEPRLERAIGVIYLPQTERRSHYFQARLADQFDYVLHFDNTRAVEPLERTAAWSAGEPAETYPTGL
jgi:erythromycin esterase-like protein/predicted phosphoribosyltransferase